VAYFDGADIAAPTLILLGWVGLTNVIFAIGSSRQAKLRRTGEPAANINEVARKPKVPAVGTPIEPDRTPGMRLEFVSRDKFKV
jgi:hypothetical protein